ncbi:HAD family hydrolase [Cellulomonas carbonis]|uniref:Haloacid dehalogenase n=1 Tax=Cellulomonas carbonis T26 TaxID=947969 RepID=A0A0A0BSS2_9CELL|nr:HAD family hydrolase [Cellulomonas carbonis]KGM10184.1 haloacid dehalogenase [Cellulomonas carbonis T26]GGC12539.1 haloacid dehalogenase [Cellulomonas carbonis]
MTGRRVDGVLFDVDDTLVDTRGAFAVALAEVARAHLPHLGEDAHPELLRVWRADAGGHYARYTSGGTDYRTQRMTRANELQAAFGGDQLDDAAYEAWNAVFEAGFSGAWTAHLDAHDVVRQLLDAGVAVAAMTNAAVAYQTTKLERAGLGEHVTVLVGVDTLGVGKPDPAVFVEACRRLGTEPARTAYVGDELDVDARAAVAAGLLGVWVDRPGPRRVDIPDEDVAAARAAGVEVVTTLAEVPGLLGVS